MRTEILTFEHPLLDLSTPLLDPIRQMDFRAMVTKAIELGVVDPILTIIAILQKGSINDRASLGWKELCEDEHESDAWANWRLFRHARRMTGQNMRDAGLHSRVYRAIFQRRGELNSALCHIIDIGAFSGTREDVIVCIVAGMLESLSPILSLGDSKTLYDFPDGNRRLDSCSVVRDASWIVGDTHEVTGPGPKGDQTTRRFVRMATRVTPAILSAVAPEQVQIEGGIDPYYDPEQDACCSMSRFIFADRIIQEELVLDPQHLEAPGLFAEWILAQMLAAEVNVQHDELGVILRENKLIRHVAPQLNIRAGEDKIPVMDEEQLIAWLWEQLGTASSIQEVPDLSVLRLEPIDAQIELRIMIENPEFIELAGAPQQMYYPEGQAPYIILTEEILHELTEDTICLPGKRVVNIFVQFGDDFWLSGSNIGELKDLIERYHQLTQHASRVHMAVSQAHMWALQAAELQRLAKQLKEIEESFPKNLEDYPAWVISAQDLLDEHATVLGPALKR